MKKLSPKRIIPILAVVLAAVIAIGSTLAYLTDSQSQVNIFTVGDLDIAQGEPNYPDDPEPTGNTPGDSYPKDPTAEAVSGDGYMRMIVEFVDTATGALITGARLTKIKETIYYDPTGIIPLDSDGEDVPVSLHKTSAELEASGLSTFNETDFYQNSGTTEGREVFRYKNSATGDIFMGPKTDVATGVETPGARAVIFTSVIIPSNWNQHDMQVLGSYKIVIQTQAIQASNFANADEAFAALDAEITANTALKDYAVTTISATEA